MNEAIPFVFEPIFKDYVWGGEKLISIKKAKGISKIAESWEISDRKEGESRVSLGKHKGKTIRNLIEEGLLGEKFTRYPLLIKLIDAKENLSIQVHPDEKSAKKLGAEPKTEMWYVLDAEAGAAVYAGFSPDSTLKQRQESLGKKEILSTLRKIPVKKGDIIYIPGGRVHAILQGCFLLEVQQNSNTTYRIYDWDRNDPNRALHLKEGKEVIHFEDIQTPLCTPKLQEKTEEYRKFLGVKTPYFEIRKYQLKGSMELSLQEGMKALFLIEGKASYQDQGKRVFLDPFRAYLFPKGEKKAKLEGKATLISVVHK